MNPAVEQVCRRASTRAVLEVAWRGGVLRADDVMGPAGVTRSTALQALDALGELGLVEEVASVEEGGPVVGRPARRFRLRADAGVVVGLEAGQHAMIATLTDLSGAVLAVRSTDIPNAVPSHLQDPGRRRELAQAVVAQVLLEGGVTTDDVVVLGIGVPAPVDGRGCFPAQGQSFWQVMHAELPEMFRRDFTHVRIENDAALAVLAELHFGAAQGQPDVVTLLLAWGTGAGVVLGGRLVRGANGAVGELGFFEGVQGIGSSVGFHEIVEDWVREHAEVTRLPPGHPWGEYLRGERAGESLLGLLSPQDPVMAPLFHELVRRTGRIVELLAQVYDPAMIVVAGPVARDLGEVLAAVRVDLARRLGSLVPELVTSPLGENVVSLGATAAARELPMEVVIEWALAKGTGKPSD